MNPWDVSQAFIEQNRAFWSAFPHRSGGKKLLIEEPSIPIITHKLGIFSLVLNQARGFKPTWLRSGKNPWAIEFLQSYVPDAEYVRVPKTSFFHKLHIVLTASWKFLVLLLTRNLLAFSYDGVKYGDIVYDTYLADAKVATIRHFDFRIFTIFCECIRRHRNIVAILKSDDFAGVIVSHRVGIQSGAMLRAALRHGYEGFLHIGYHQCTLQRFTKPSDVYIFENAASPAEADEILSLFGPKLDVGYQAVYDAYVGGKSSVEANYAFNPNNKRYSDRETFHADWKLDKSKKNVFVMLHAFNDYPHSHFRGMLFADYYDWMMKTLEFAKTCNTVNWVFKQHPTVKMYPTEDVSFAEIFGNLPPHVVYIDEHRQIDTRSLIVCADTVITCLGSAGFELPAMAAIPSIVASDTFYVGLGFTAEPKTQREYFDVLGKLHTWGRLTSEQQKRARAAYMHIYQFSTRMLAACPRLSYEQQKDTASQSTYWDTISGLYKEKGEQILGDVRGFMSETEKNAFVRTSTLREFHAKFTS